MSEEVIAKSTAEATVNAPLHAIDLTEWVFTLTDAEYQACSVNHIAAAATVTPDERRMSINVETPLFVRDIERKAAAHRW